MKHHAWDAVNGTAAVGFVATYLAGWNWSTIAALLAAIYSLLLIGEKAVSIYRRLRAWWKTRE